MVFNIRFMPASLTRTGHGSTERTHKSTCNFSFGNSNYQQVFFEYTGLQRTVFNEAVTAAEKQHASTEADEQWLSVNTDILLENKTVHAMQLVDHMIMFSGGQF